MSELLHRKVGRSIAAGGDTILGRFTLSVRKLGVTALLSTMAAGPCMALYAYFFDHEAVQRIGPYVIGGGLGVHFVCLYIYYLLTGRQY